MSVHSPSHPIWPIIRLTVIMAALVAILWANAAEFDETELRTIFFMSFAAAGVETVAPLVRKFTKSDNDGK